jgi:uncharacterized protein (TIGR02646 family)
MRAIAKGKEPLSLTRHRLRRHANYDNYTGKGDLRRGLVAEQRGLCCYCMGRIRSGPTTMKIEHWRCQARYPAEQLKYKNLLGACNGGDGQPPQLQHCDTRKGDRDLRWNPANPAHRIEARVGYQSDGTVYSVNADFNAQLVEVLHLNLPVLKNHRKGVLTSILEWWGRERAGKGRALSRARMRRERDKRTGGSGDLAPYCRVAVWWLEERLR